MSYTFLRPKRMPKFYTQKLAGLFIALTALIAAPVIYAAGLIHQLTLEATATICMGATGVALFIYALRALSRGFGSLCIVIILGASILIRLAYLGLIQFSGAGFNAEFFLHLGGESAIAAWRMFGLWLVAGLIGTAFYLLISCLVALRLPRPTPVSALIIALVTPFTIFVSRAQLPEAQLANASRPLIMPINIPGYAELLQRWQNNALVETKITPKTQLQTTLPEKPRNLILVYLESVGQPVINHPDWPGLMPHLSELVEQHSIADSVYASSFITIEGIVNTQCGTLFPFDRGSDSLANGHNLGDNLPCLADVLEHAGYQNRYLGGAELAFAGKGRFLQSHGFNEPMGLNYWRAQGIRQRPGTWGISDPDLFDQALMQYKELSKRGEPFNITLLTIGTHLPGFYYEECERYDSGDDPFLDGLHCTDQLLHRWLEQLESLGAFEDTTVVITADHSVFSSPAMTNLFGDAVEDRRVPLVVLGPRQPHTATIGAGYDLAPTVLDLLGIKHNATFALGRSLLKPNTRPAYLLSRYTEVYDGKIHGNFNRQCNGAPLTTYVEGIPDACQRDDLFSLLRRQIEGQSYIAAQISCDDSTPVSITFPATKDAPLQMQLQSKNIGHYFSQEGRKIKNSAGLYLLWFDANGRLESTEYATAKGAESELRTLPQSDITRGWIAVWVAPQDATKTNLPPWLDVAPEINSVSLGHVGQAQAIHWKSFSPPKENTFWALSAQECHSNFFNY